MMEAGHAMRCDVGRAHDETLGIGPGLGRHRDGFRTEGGMSHNSITPSRPHLKVWEGWSMPIPWHLAPKITGNMEEGQARTVPCSAQRNSWQLWWRQMTIW